MQSTSWVSVPAAVHPELAKLSLCMTYLQPDRDGCASAVMLEPGLPSSSCLSVLLCDCSSVWKPNCLILLAFPLLTEMGLWEPWYQRKAIA